MFTILALNASHGVLAPTGDCVDIAFERRSAQPSAAPGSPHLNVKSKSYRNSLPWISMAAALLPISAAAEPENVEPDCVPIRDSYYDPKAIRLGQYGTVLVEYSVNEKGATERVTVLKSTASGSLERSAVRLVKSMQCKLGEDWQLSGGPQRRFKINVLFQFRGGEPASPIDPAAEVITITTDPV